MSEKNSEEIWSASSIPSNDKHADGDADAEEHSKGQLGLKIHAAKEDERDADC